MGFPEGGADFFPGDGLPDGFQAFNALPDFSQDFPPLFTTIPLDEAIRHDLLPGANLTATPMIVEDAVDEGSSQPYFPDYSNLYPLTDGRGRILDENGDPVPTAYGGLVDAAIPEGGVDPGFQIATPHDQFEQPTRSMQHDAKGFGYVEMTEEI